jgi:ATP-binding cassette subfamily F protein 3
VDATAERLWIVRDGTVRPFDGDMADYRAELLAARSGQATRGASEREKSASRADARRATAERRAEIAPLRKAMQAAERKVAELSTRLAVFDRQLADPDLYAKAAATAQALSIDRAKCAKELAAAEDVWLEATQSYEEAQAAAGL